jgi:hypothetical protein
MSLRLRKCAMKREEIVAAGGAHCDGAFVLWFFGIVFVVFGVVSDGLNVTLVLEPISWFLLAIFFGLSAAVSWITWMLAVHLDAIEAKSRKED